MPKKTQKQERNVEYSLQIEMILQDSWGIQPESGGTRASLYIHGLYTTSLINLLLSIQIKSL